MMGYARHKVKSEKPTEVFIVTDGRWHKLYSTIGAARGVRTTMKKYPWNGPVKIYRLEVSDQLEEVDADNA